MSLPKLLGITALVLFTAISCIALYKSASKPERAIQVKRDIKRTDKAPAVALGQTVRVVKPETKPVASKPATVPQVSETPASESSKISAIATSETIKAEVNRQPPEASDVERFFIRDAQQFPIVETITYSSKVPWLKGRPAWVSDYASHYKTSRHFIARSLHGGRDYLKQDIREGQRFNVLRTDKNINFHLVVDLTRAKMWFYYLDLDTKERVLVKTYDVGVGKLDSSSPSGFLSPLGRYSLGSNTAVYAKNEVTGPEAEITATYGSRWIPFAEELGGCTAPAKGLGLHGAPRRADAAAETLVDDNSGIGQHASDGCISLSRPDIEELFAIIVSRPTTIELVADFFDAELPGEEKRS